MVQDQRSSSLIETVGPHWSWNSLKFWDKYYKEIQPKLQAMDMHSACVYPLPQHRFKALELGPEDTKVIILGQDPYPTKGHADGLAFSTHPHVTPYPASLRTILRELEEDTGVKARSGSLSAWHSRGIQLLNTALTVEVGKPGSHIDLWKGFAYEALSRMSRCEQPIAWLLWGKQAQQYQALVPKHHLLLTAGHPSPLSSRLFRGCRHFSQAAEFLNESPDKLWAL